LSPRALMPLPSWKRWVRNLDGVRMLPPRTAGKPYPKSDLDSAKGVIGSGVTLIVGYAVIALLVSMLFGCGGGGGSSSAPPASSKPSAPAPGGSSPPPTTPAPAPSAPAPGVFKSGPYYCAILGADGVCKIGEGDATWMPAADVQAARIAPAQFNHADGVYAGKLDGVAMTLVVAGQTLTGQSSAGCVLNGTWAANGPLLFDFVGSASCAGGGQLTGMIAFVPSGQDGSDIKLLLAARGASSAHVTFIGDGAPNQQPSPTDCSSRPRPSDELRFTTCPANTGPGTYTQTRTAVCSSPPEWSFGSWLPSQPSAAECPPIVAPPPTCGAAPPDGTRTSTECPAGLEGSWTQTHGWIEAAYPQCYEPEEWTPDVAPDGACQLPPDPLFGMHGVWGWPPSFAEFCDITPAGVIHCVLSFNSAAQILDGSVLPGGTGTTRSLRDGVFGPARGWTFIGWSTNSNANNLSLSFSGDGAPPGSGVLAEMKRVEP
ncbi:MAG: hypothetical protein ACREXP_19890, partial [Steroidobacteraceae bacterium]